MSKALPGWMPYIKAEHAMWSAGLFRYGVGWALLAAVPKRRLQPHPGKRRRKHWYIRQQDVDHMMEEARAQITAIALDGGGLMRERAKMAGFGTSFHTDTGFYGFYTK